MAKKRARKAPDPNRMAFGVLSQVIGKHDPGAEVPPPPDTVKPTEGKNPAAVELGRLGGLKGGPARAKKLGKKKLSEIGKKAAPARWNRPPVSPVLLSPPLAGADSQGDKVAGRRTAH